MVERTQGREAEGDRALRRSCLDQPERHDRLHGVETSAPREATLRETSLSSDPTPLARAGAVFADEVAAADETDVPAAMGQLAPLWSLALQRLIVSATSRQDRLLTMEQVAERLEIKVGRAREMGRKGQLPTVALGDRGIRVRQRSLEDYIRRRERKG